MNALVQNRDRYRFEFRSLASLLLAIDDNPERPEHHHESKKVVVYESKRKNHQDGLQAGRKAGGIHNRIDPDPDHQIGNFTRIINNPVIVPFSLGHRCDPVSECV